MAKERAARGKASAPAPTRGAGAIPFVPAVALVVVAAFAAHVRSLDAPFFADDWLFLDQVRMRSLLTVLTSPDPIGNYFRPLARQLWFALWAAVSGESPFVFHAANLTCLMLAIVLLARLGRRVAGPVAGVIAAAFLALHYATDVPVLWASGSQELLSVVLVLAALELHAAGARLAGAGVFLAALFAKESVVLAPLAAMMLDRAGGSWRARAQRAWGWGVAVGVWLVAAGLAAAARGTSGAGVQLTPMGPLAAPVLLVRVALGAEWVTGALPWTRGSAPTAGGAFAMVAALAAVLWVTSRSAAGKPAANDVDAAAGARAGLVWALAGALPVAAVAPLWSAYYFLFAICGVGLALGAWLSRRPVAVTIGVLAALAWSSSMARGLQEFATAPSPWSAQSHVNRFYLERGMSVISRGIADLRAQMPAPEPRTTVFVAGLPSFAAFQVGDGPLMRGVYRDTTLRSYYLSQLSQERLERGPWRIFFYDGATGRLKDNTHTPGVLLSTALGMLYNGQLEVAEAALQAALKNGEEDMGHTYVSAWVAYDRGDRALAMRRLEAAGYRAGAAVPGLANQLRRRVGAGDTLGAQLALRQALREHALDPDLHGLAAELFMSSPELRSEGGLEAYAGRLLAPGDGVAWRRWASALINENRVDVAVRALDEYARLSPARYASDAEARGIHDRLRRMLPGGDLAQRALKREYRPD